MAKRRAKKKAKPANASHPRSTGNDFKESTVVEKQIPFLVQEVERQSMAIRAIRDVEIEHLLTGLHLLRSCFNEEQLKTPALQFFKENFSSLSMLQNMGNGEIEGPWENKGDSLSVDNDKHIFLLHRLSMGFPDFPSFPSFRGFELSSDTGRPSFLAANDLPLSNFGLEGPYDMHVFGMQDALRTPGVSNQRLSVGITPKSRRLPKHGEMLLSIHGSPLGIYKEDNMEAIQESEEGGNVR